jgi:hypothetical protein
MGISARWIFWTDYKAMTLAEFIQGAEWHSPTTDGHETDWLEIGLLSLSGSLWVGDGCSVGSADGSIIPISRGDYRLEGKGITDSQNWHRVSRVRLIRKNAEVSNRGENLGQVGIDTATLAFFDADYIEACRTVVYEELRDQIFDASRDGAGIIEAGSAAVLRIGVCSTGYGDGSYDIIALNDAREKVGLEIQFIEFD